MRCLALPYVQRQHDVAITSESATQAEEAAQTKLSKCLSIPGTPQVQIEKAQLSLELASSVSRMVQTHVSTLSAAQQATQRAAAAAIQIVNHTTDGEQLLHQLHSMHEDTFAAAQAHAAHVSSAELTLQQRLQELMAASERIRNLADAQATANGAKQSLDIMLASKDETMRKQAQELADMRQQHSALSQRLADTKGDLLASNDATTAAQKEIAELQDSLRQAHADAQVRAWGCIA